MSKSLKRITIAELLKGLEDLKNQNLHFILKNKSVVLGKPYKFDKKIFIVKDAMGHNIKLPLQAIQEIWKDSKVDQ